MSSGQRDDCEYSAVTPSSQQLEMAISHSVVSFLGCPIMDNQLGKYNLTSYHKFRHKFSASIRMNCLLRHWQWDK